MKIALVSDWYPPRRGGIESHLSELGRRLADAGHEVHVVTSTRGGDAPTAPNAVAVHRLDARLLPGLDLVFTPRGIKAIARTLDEIEPDVVHSHVSIVSPVAFAGAHHAQRRRLATVLTFHSFIPATRAYMRGAALLTGSRRWRAVFTAVSGRVAREVAPFSGSRPVGLLPNAVDVSYWHPAAEQPGSGNAPLRIVSAMRLNAKKRPDVLIRLAEYLRDRPPAAGDATILIAGDGPMRDKLSRAIARKGLEAQVRMLGHLGRNQLRELYASADIFVLPTIRESFGLAALEARSMGLPVVAMKVSGLAEQITDGSNGLIAASDTEFFACTRRLIDDARLRGEITARNRSTPFPLDWSRCIRDHESVYASAIELMASETPR